MRTSRLGAAVLMAAGVLAPAAAAAAATTPSFAGRVFVVAGAGSHVVPQSDRATIRGEGEPASTAWLGTTVTTLARAADGSVLIGTDGALWRVEPDQRLTRVLGGIAGTPTWADGTPARAAALSDVTGLAAAADGSVVLSDQAARTVVRIDPDGLARRVPGAFCAPGPLLALAGGDVLLGDCTAVRRLGADGALAPFADAGPNHTIGDLARAADGTVLLSSPRGEILRLTATGRPALVAGGLTRPGPLAALADGGVLVTDERRGRIVRIDAAGTRRTVFGARPTVGGRPDGAAANDLALRGGIADLLPLPDGSLLVADRSSPRVLMVASARPQTLALALCRRICPPRGRVPVLATRPGAYALRVTDRVTGVVSVRAGRLPAGASLLTPGGDTRHRRQLTVTLTGDDGQTTRQVRLLQAAR